VHIQRIHYIDHEIQRALQRFRESGRAPQIGQGITVHVKSPYGNEVYSVELQDLWDAAGTNFGYKAKAVLTSSARSGEIITKPPKVPQHTAEAVEMAA
jgi:hypothetical protein